MNRTKFGGIFKKATALLLSAVMLFGAVTMLPDSVMKDNLTTASAYSIEIDGNTFVYSISERTYRQSVVIEKASVNNKDGIVEIPSTLKCGSKEYPVTDIGKSFLQHDEKTKELIMPDSIEYIGDRALWHSKIEKLTISKNVEHIGYGFAAYCYELNYQNVKYVGSKVSGFDMGESVFLGSGGMMNEKNAICLGNWLLKYIPDYDETYLRPADLGNGDTKINSIAPSAITTWRDLTTVDLKGIEFVGDKNFANYSQLRNIVNDDSIKAVGEKAFNGTPWLEQRKGNDIIKLGTSLIKYTTYDNVIDLTSGELAGTTNVAGNAFADCVNADTLICNSYVQMRHDCFYEEHKQPVDDSLFPDKMPVISTHKIKNIYLDGKKLEYTANDPILPIWVRDCHEALIGTEWLKRNVEAKTKDLFRQLDITYYGMENDKVGTLSPTQEFYIMLKVHDYLSIYSYDRNLEYCGAFVSFLLGKKVDCQGYADLAHYMFECAGVDTTSLYDHKCNYHVWNSVKIGGEWFETDNGWDAQRQHTYGLFALSSPHIQTKTGKSHNYEYACKSWHISLFYGYQKINPGVEREEAERTLGDINGNGERDTADCAELWNYVKGKTLTIDKKAADINFDGIIDVTDAVLLDNFVKGSAVSIMDYPSETDAKDALSPGFKAAFINGTDNSNIIYERTDKDGCIELPEVMFDAPEGMISDGWDIGKPGETVKISNPYTVIQPIWKNGSDVDDDSSSSEPNYSSSGPDEVSSEPDDTSSKHDEVSSGPDDTSSKHDEVSSKPDDTSSKHDDISSEAGDSKPDTDDEKQLLGDVDGNSVIDIEDITMLINHINGVRALDDEEMLRADVDGSKTVDISDAVTIINHINGISTIA